jgi:hypothetical protein
MDFFDAVLGKKVKRDRPMSRRAVSGCIITGLFVSLKMFLRKSQFPSMRCFTKNNNEYVI